MSDKILVCGAGGFLGGHMIELLLRRGHRPQDIRAVSNRAVHLWLKRFEGVENIQMDLRYAIPCENAVHGMDWIYNFAAKVGGIHYIAKEQKASLLASLINTNLLLAAEHHPVSGYFFASSACVYGSADEGAIKETAPLNPSPGYGDEKVFSEKMCLAFSDKIPIRIARYTGIYGPGDDTKGAENRDHAPSALCRKVIKAKLENSNDISIWGDGEQTRNFLYVEDAAEAAYRIMTSGCGTFPINVGSREVVSINQVVSVLEEIAGIKLNRCYQRDATQGVRNRSYDLSLLWDVTRWEPGTQLKEGLRATYNDLLFKSR